MEVSGSVGVTTGLDSSVVVVVVVEDSDVEVDVVRVVGAGGVGGSSLVGAASH
jgi:hypothetical protein